jgi:hypothetical protein
MYTGLKEFNICSLMRSMIRPQKAMETELPRQVSLQKVRPLGCFLSLVQSMLPDL